jgi:hypothetical protein
LSRERQDDGPPSCITPDERVAVSHDEAEARGLKAFRFNENGHASVIWKEFVKPGNLSIIHLQWTACMSNKPPDGTQASKLFVEFVRSELLPESLKVFFREYKRGTESVLALY